MNTNCQFCQQNDSYIDYKNTELLQRFTSAQAKIYSTRRTGLCKKHQRRIAEAIKRARFMALMPFIR